MDLEDIIALEKSFNLVKAFIEKNIIKKSKVNYSKIEKNIKQLKSLKGNYTQETIKLLNKTLKKLSLLVNRELPLTIYYFFGAHGGVIINDVGFCEFDSPRYALDNLLNKMNLSIKTNQPYNLEIAISCLEWLKNNYINKFNEFLKLYEQGQFEIINPTYTQPYNLIISAESNIKQFEYGLKVLKELGLESKIFYSSESSVHPQIPQILKGFGIKHGSLRTRLLGIHPTSASAFINWIGLDNTSIDTIINQSGVFNGEYWHGTFFKEIPNLLFQAISYPFLDYILYSSIEDFVNPHPYQEDIWRISCFSEIFGKFLLCSDFFNIVEKEGEFKYQRDDFKIADYIFFYSELFLQNKNSEISILTAEVINSVLGFFGYKSNNSLFEDLWKQLLLTQAHDCYAVPFIRSGDYTQIQLGKDELKKLEIISSNKTISDVSLQIHKEIQERCEKFINDSLSYLVKELSQKENDSKNRTKNIFVFNPTPYTRRDVISVYSEKDSVFHVIEEVPQFGYKIVSYKKRDNSDTSKESEFLFNMEILPDLKTIQITYKSNKIFELRFNLKQEYRLYLEKQNQDDVVDSKIIIGKLINQTFKIELVQYRKINRLEIFIDSDSLQEIILTPLIELKKSIINYPFGIEETRRSHIQTLDFIWLKGSKQGIIYIQKNSQRFIIDRENFEIRNLLTKRGRYEFAISITDENNSISPLFYVNSFYFKFLTINIDKDLHFTNNFEKFLSIEHSISVINLWRRDKKYFLRLLNPSNKECTIKVNGKLIKNQIKEIDLNFNVLSSLDSNNVKIGPWKIKTLKF